MRSTSKDRPKPLKPSPHWWLNLLENTAEKLFSLRSLHEFYGRIPLNEENGNLFHAVLNTLHIKYIVSADDFSKIPPEGPTVVVSNHPFGGLDAIIIAALLSEVRSDIKILGNYFLESIPQVKDWNIPVSTSARKEHVANNANSIRKAIRWVERGGLLITFPSGDYSSANRTKKGVLKGRWKSHIGGIIRLAQAKTLPLYFPGKTSNVFQFIGLIHPRLRRNLLPNELIKKTSETIDLFVGKPILWKKLQEIESDRKIIRSIKNSTFFLKNRVPQKSRDKSAKEVRHQEPVVEALPVRELEDEIRGLPDDTLYYSDNDYVIHIARAEQLPRMLLEIGRLRELTFRAVQEGTGKSIDLDSFDPYYRHVFLWSRNEKQLIGSYRLGLTDEILRQYGPKGLYTFTLFKFKPELLHNVQHSIEMGRSFIRIEYQKQYSMLLLLWKGIAQFIVRNPQYRMLFGPVSISHDYNPISQNLMYNFLKKHNVDLRLSRHVKPRTPFHPARVKGVNKRLLLSSLKDIDDVSILISELEKDGKGVPVLLRHYLKLNASLLSFNVDKDFSSVLDGLILVDLKQTEPAILKRFMGKDGYQAFLDFQNKEKYKVDGPILLRNDNE